MTRLASTCRTVTLAFRCRVVFLAVAFAAIDSAHALDVSVGPKEVIYTSKQRKSKGLKVWPDGNFGVVATGQWGYEFYAANARKPTKSVGTLTDPAKKKQKVSITNLPKRTFDYVAGGPIYYDPATGARLMIYHAEKHGRNRKDFYSVLGMAVSTDPAGVKFRDLGTIIEPNLQSGLAEVGGGSFAVVDNHLHVYFRDWFPNGTTSEVAVARAPISDLVSNALNGVGTSFNKYYNGSWTQPGRGGLSSPLEIGNPANSWLGVSYNDYLDELVMVTSHWKADRGDLYLATSPDGINWSTRQPIVLDAGEQFYPSLIGTGSDPTHTGQSFYVYYTDSQKGAWNRQKDALLVRREITIDPITLVNPVNPPEIPLPGPLPTEPPPATPTNWTQVADFQSDFQRGGPAEGWTYAWNPTGQLGNSGAFASLAWSDVAGVYNTTGGATPTPGGKNHNDDYLSLHASGGHPGRPNYLPIVGYTIQADDGDGQYRIAESSIAKFDGITAKEEDGLQVLVYLNNSLVGPSQHVGVNGLLSKFDRELGELQVGDTVWVMVSPLNNQFYDSFHWFDFTIQKGALADSAFAAALTVPEPSTAILTFLALAGCSFKRSRRDRIGS